MGNPFVPTLGYTPPHLVGRDEIIEDFRDGLETGPGHPSRIMLVSGARGTGKTVMLNVLESEAEAVGWRTIRLSTRPGMARELVESRLPSLMRELDVEPRSGRHISNVGVSVLGFGGNVGVHTADPAAPVPNLLLELEAVTSALAKREQGLLLTIDEVHRSAADDLRTIAQDVQVVFGKQLPVAIITAGLPAAVSDLLNDDVLTFLRRAERYELGPVGLEQVKDALVTPIKEAGRSITPEALEIAAAGTQGYPFLIQSIGFDTWRAARDSGEISAEHAELGIRKAMRRIGSALHEPSLHGLSNADKSYLAAMAVDDGPSHTGTVAERLGVSSSYASAYRARLIEAGLIEQTSYGYVGFKIPYLRDYLREHVAVEALQRSRSALSAADLRAKLSESIARQTDLPAPAPREARSPNPPHLPR